MEDCKNNSIYPSLRQINTRQRALKVLRASHEVEDVTFFVAGSRLRFECGFLLPLVDYSHLS